MMRREAPPEGRGMFERVGQWLTHAEDLIYLAAAVLLISAAVGLLTASAIHFVQTIAGETRATVLQMLDTLLLVLMLVEILHTVGISLREHMLMSEPFLTVGLIAAIRRILVITAEQPRPDASTALTFQLMMLELGLLTVLILALVGAISIVRRRTANAPARVEPGPTPDSYTLHLPDGTDQVVAPREHS